ncbi:MAG: hypothetical protein AMS24_03575 [Chlamydiae bacterium SM23_39]|nr:MAG: hypothetical protein AMS24_03575 [Chlamydiae bacterium SM23_39]
MQKKRIAAIDYGKKRIGISITSPDGKIALPYKTIDTGKNLEESSNNIINSLNPYIENIKEIVLGNPLFLSGKESEMSKEVTKLKAILSKKLNIPIILWDERLTSSEAEKILKEQKIPRKKRKRKVDPIAATIILRSYLDAKKI